MYKLVVLSCVLLISQLTYADIYKYTAPDGSVYYTDKPKKGFNYKRVTKSKKTKRSKSAQYSLRNIKKNKKKYSPLIAQVAAKYNLDVNLLHAVIRTESAYNESAESSAGAVGLMQLMPQTAKRYGVSNRKNPAQNVDGGARYLKDLLKMFNSNLYLALAGYNAGEGAVKKYHNSIPPYPETKAYVRKVLKRYKAAGQTLASL